MKSESKQSMSPTSRSLSNMDDATLKSNDDFHADAMSKYKAALEFWQPIFDQYDEDIDFLSGNQWDDKVKAAREAAGLSVLVYDQIESKVKYIVNNARANTPAIKCAPVDAGADKNTARIFDGLIKHIQYKHDAKHAYINALQNIVGGGIGAWRVNPVKTAEGEYDIEILRITDPTTVIIDPTAKKQDFSDAEYCFVLTPVVAEDVEELYDVDDVCGVGDAPQEGQINVLEYWKLNRKTGYWEQYILSNDSILESNTEYRGKYMPITFITGEELHIKGERMYKGIVRNVKDMQMLLNLAKSRTADSLAKGSSGQWLTEADMIADYKEIWMSPEVNGIPVLPYKATAGGKPERVDPPPPPVGFQSVASEADADIRANIGIRDPLQDVPSSQSGKAIALQISQGNIGTFAFMDKLNSGVKYTGTVLVDLIPQYYSYPHIREIMGLDNQISTVPLNEPYEQNGELVMHDLSKGRYAVMIQEGPSYESQRTEASDKLLELSKIYPQFLQLAGDIIFRNMDFQGADEIADRLRSQVPPEVLAASSSNNMDDRKQLMVTQDQLRQQQAGIQQLQQQVQQLTQLNQQLIQERDAKIAEINARGQVDANLRQLDHQFDLELEDRKNLGRGQLEQIKGDVNSQLQTQRAHTEVFKQDMQHQLSNPQTNPTTINIDVGQQG